jgi:hypothetical protein
MATVVEAVVAPTEELGEVAISAEAGSKKKNKRKKKKAGALAAGEDDDGEEVAEPAVASLQKMEYADQQQFDEWCTSALQKVPSTIPGGTDVYASPLSSPAQLVCSDRPQRRRRLALPKMHWGYKFTGASLPRPRAAVSTVCTSNACFGAGPLRPAFVSPQRHKLPETIVKPDYAFPNDGTPLSEVRFLARIRLSLCAEPSVGSGTRPVSARSRLRCANCGAWTLAWRHDVRPQRGQSDSRIPVLTTEQIDKMRYTCKLGREVRNGRSRT